MEKLNLRKVCKIFCECRATSGIECESCPLQNIYDENGKDLCILFSNIEDSIIRYNKEFLTEE